MHTSAIHLKRNRRLVKTLMNVHVGGALDASNLSHQLAGKLLISRVISPNNLNINGGGDAEIQNLRHEVSRLVEKLNLREIFAQFW